MSSACEVLTNEPRRFLDYILSNPYLRKRIVDKASFGEALKKAFSSDTSLKSLLDEMRIKGESVEICGQNIFELEEIQSMIEDNKKLRLGEFKKRVKIQHPTYKRKQVTKEATRRLKISISGQANRIAKTTRQITIQEALKPVKVGSYMRDGKLVKGKSKSAYKKLNMQEQMLIENAIRKNKSASETIGIYLQSGLGEGYRTKTSIQRHYDRIKKKIK